MRVSGTMAQANTAVQLYDPSLRLDLTQCIPVDYSQYTTQSSAIHSTGSRPSDGTSMETDAMRTLGGCQHHCYARE